VDFSRSEEERPNYFSCEKMQSLLLVGANKFGIEVPKTVKEDLELDRKNGNTFWSNAIAKEMKDICIDFKSYLMGSLRQLATRRYPAT
jgi:hypothetical protein